MVLLIDTNILLDFLLRRAPHSAHADRLADRVEAGEVTAHVSAISFNNVYYLAEKKRGDVEARRMLANLRRLFGVVPLDVAVLDDALASSLSDFEDAIQAVSARHASADCVVTRNSQDFVGCGLPTYSAEEVLALLDAQS
jgi:predicted nucleic acid-binding protein